MNMIQLQPHTITEKRSSNETRNMKKMDWLSLHKVLTFQSVNLGMSGQQDPPGGA